ncbi:FG-GAP repeat protein [Streptomyces sp. WMMC500]|uniref:FG-GAP repeat protein n=1 Tax=Streptomyces sp. WMMC500 TaxID=3015154 RepID=UPI00248D237D|nr:FG-GAP repeat protein [Streptomyces sp. WMMC500]WBB64323.1 FG-GAP repeat protein [Streptomyces sp. WMMC500]
MRIRTLAALTACLATAGTAAVTAPATGAEDRGTAARTAPAAPPGAGVGAGAADSRAAADTRTVRADFDGDGYDDLATGAPGGTVAGHAEAGYVLVSYGSADGVAAPASTVLSQRTAGVPGAPAADDRFGDRLAARDLDGDGLTDLAVTARAEDGDWAGSVTVLWGRESGLTGAGAARAQVPGGGGLGVDLHGGDFDGDGTGDLLVPNTRGEAGQAYSVLYGPFTRAGAPARESALVEMKPEDDVDGMAVGDVTGDGADDLVAFFSFQGNAEGGWFWQGGPDGLTQSGTLPSGGSPAIGDFDGDGRGDVAYRSIGASVEDFPYDEGTVKVVYGTAGGPSQTRRQTFTQDTAGVPGTGERGDQFGARLAAGDANGDGRDDLAVGVPYEAIGSKRWAGSAVLLQGGSGGLKARGAQAFHQDTAGVKGVAEAGDRFGAALAFRDVTDDGRAELAVGAPDENGTGAIWSLRGAAGGLSATGSVAFSPDNFEVPGGTGAGSRFGTGFAGEDAGHYLRGAE